MVPSEPRRSNKLAISEMRLTCSASFLRSAEGPQRLRGLFAARGTSETAVFYGRQHENIEHVAPALFEMRQAYDINAQRTGRAPVCTENLNPTIVVMKSAQNGA